MNNLEQSYKKILEVLSKFFGNKLQNYQRRTPKMSDLEVVSLALTAEYLSIDSECQLFRKIPESIFLNKSFCSNSSSSNRKSFKRGKESLTFILSFSVTKVFLVKLDFTFLLSSQENNKILIKIKKTLIIPYIYVYNLLCIFGKSTKIVPKRNSPKFSLK